MMKFAEVFCILTAIVASTAQQDQVYRLLEQVEYVNRVFFKLLIAHLGTAEIPDPMLFDDFTFNHSGVLKSGVSHTYDPLLQGYSDSTFEVDVTEDTYNALLLLTIPEARLTGRYDLWIDEILLLPPFMWRYRGSGDYTHTFNDVQLLINFTIGRTEDDSRTVPTDIHTTLAFRNCSIWAANFTENNVEWNGERWFNQSRLYKLNFDDESRRHDILISESISSYFGVMWGILDFTKDQARESLLGFGSNSDLI